MHAELKKMMCFMSVHTCMSDIHLSHFLHVPPHTHTHNTCSQPENILLDDQNNVKVSDFGFSTIIQPGQTLSGTLCTCTFIRWMDGRGRKGGRN